VFVRGGAVVAGGGVLVCVAGADVFVGVPGADVFVGVPGAGVLVGVAGAEVFVGVAGPDVLVGVADSTGVLVGVGNWASVSAATIGVGVSSKRTTAMPTAYIKPTWPARANCFMLFLFLSLM
jgi:hypothetical protein